jgi:hypothetical protein
MKSSTIILTSTTACVISLLCAGGSVYASPPDGMYVGTTGQGHAFEIRVTDGRVDQWYYYVSISCAYGSVSGGERITISPGCAIEADGTFVCGSTTCSPYSAGSEVGGQFSVDNTVTGNIGLAVRFGNVCCYPVISYEASLLVEELFADGFESGDTSEWSNTVP